jgi:putative chitinase
MSPEDLAVALGIPPARATTWADPLSAAMALYSIDTPVRQAAFLAQVGHESGRLVYVHELWGPTAQQKGYEGRADLGNIAVGDGFKYRGRGLIQVTGRANYTTAAVALNLSLVDHPELLEDPDNAALSAAWFWNAHNLNDLADAGAFETITRRINGGLNGLADRLVLWGSAKAALGVS